MRTSRHGTVQVGQLIAAVFDEAAEYSTDPREVSRLATQAVIHMLQRASRVPISPHDVGVPKRADAKTA